MKALYNLIVILFLIIFSGCDIKSPVEGVILIFNTDGAETSVSLTFIDAATGELIGFNDQKKINVTIEGRSKSEVVNLVLLPETSFRSDKGFLSFGFRNEASFPLDIIVIARTAGYLSTGIPVSVGEKGASAFEIYMVDINNPPAGVTVIQDFSASANSTGALTDDLILQTPPDISGGTNAYSSVNFPEGTILKNKEGIPLSGNLKTTLAYFNNRNESSLSSFPGSLNSEVNISGNRQYASFYSGGFAYLEIIDGNNREAKEISKEIPSLTIQIPNPTFNIDEGRNVQQGDIIPVWSYDIFSGEWNLESPGNIKKASNDNFEVTHQLMHLSYYNLDWFGTNICGSSIRVNFQNVQCSTIPLKLKIYRMINGEEYYMRTVYIPANQTGIRFLNAPSGSARIRAFFNQTIPAGVLDIPELCASGEINFPINAGTDFQNITANVRGFCPNNPNIEVRPTIPVWYRPAGTNSWSLLGNMVNGLLIINCFPFGVYDVAGYFDNDFVIESNININSTNINIDFHLPPGSCN